MKKLYSILLLCLLGMALYTLAAPGVQRSTPAAAASGQRSAPVISAQPGADLVTGAPSISASFINGLLCKYGSPACGDGQQFYTYGKRYGIDPVWPLAIFWNESNFGRAGEARVSLSIGNLRCLDQEHYGDLGTWCKDGYAWFPTWQAGIEACYRLLAGPLYVSSGLLSIERIIERWAPASDGNNPAHYIAVVRAAVRLWRAGKEQVPS